MTDPTEANVRTTIGISDTSVLTSARITLAIADAKKNTGSSDEESLRFYTCYLIAKQWDTINRTKAIEGVQFDKPNPQAFLDLYNDRQKQLMSEKSTNKVPFSKLSTSRDFSYDETDLRIRPRRGTDPYY